MNIGDLIRYLEAAAEALPDGLDSEVRVHLCNGHEAPGVFTKMVGVSHGEPGDGKFSRWAVIEAHPHSDDEDTVYTPMTMGVDDELARMAAGDAPPRAGITVALGDTGEGMRLPYDQDGRVLLPGSEGAVLEGCLCDPEKNKSGRGISVPENDSVAFVYNRACPLHVQVRVDPDA